MMSFVIHYAGWKAQPSADEKFISIIPPEGSTFGLNVEIDYDDVNHTQVKAEVSTLLRILHNHWPEARR